MSEQLEDGGIAPGATLFDQSVPGRSAGAQLLPPPPPLEEPLEGLRRMQGRRRFQRFLSFRWCVTSRAYRGVTLLSIGSFTPWAPCTMKYNPRGAHRAARPAWVPRSSPVGADVPVAGASERFP